MAKRKVSVQEVKLESAGNQFFDRIEDHWFAKEGTNTVTLCESVNDMLEGNSETFEFTVKTVSKRFFQKKEKQYERNYFVLFALENGDYLLLSRRKELK